MDYEKKYNVDPCDASCDAYYQRGLNKGYELGLEAGRKEQKPELVQHPPITYTYNSNASRDERLKAALLALLNSDLLKVKEGGYFTKQDLIEWVERIPTDKLAEWSEDIILKAVKEVGLTQHQIDWFKTNVFPPNPAWSEEDESMRWNIISVIGQSNCVQADDMIDWLKSLRPCPSWKPSEEQMEALRKAVNKLAKTDVADSVRLSIMYDNLKKL